MVRCFYTKIWTPPGGTAQNAHDITSLICGAAYVDGGYVNIAVNLANDHFNGQTYGFPIDGAQTESHINNSVFYGEVPFAVHNQIGTPPGGGAIHMGKSEMNNIGLPNSTNVYPTEGICSMWLGAAGAIYLEGVNAHNGIFAASLPGPLNSPWPNPTPTPPWTPAPFQPTNEVQIIGSSIQIGKPHPTPSPTPLSGSYLNCSAGAIEVQDAQETNVDANHITVAGGYTGGYGIILDSNTLENNITGNVIDTANGTTVAGAIMDNAPAAPSNGTKDVIVGNSIRNTFGSTPIIAPAGTITGNNGP